MQNIEKSNQDTNSPKRYARKKEMEQRYGVCSKTITKWTHMKLLVAIEIGRVIRFDVEGSDESLRKHGYLS